MGAPGSPPPQQLASSHLGWLWNGWLWNGTFSAAGWLEMPNWHTASLSPKQLPTLISKTRIDEDKVCSGKMLKWSRGVFPPSWLRSLSRCCLGSPLCLWSPCSSASSTPAHPGTPCQRCVTAFPFLPHSPRDKNCLLLVKTPGNEDFGADYFVTGCWELCVI